MSDVTVAPPGAAPSAAPSSPQTSEVVINQNPTTSPNPIGSQAPPAPTGEVKGSEHHPKSRAETLRDSVQEAFERSKSQLPKIDRGKPDREAPKAAEAKAGHNKPPEPTEKLDLKKRPDEQPRGERGRFESREPPGEQGEIRRGHFDTQAGVKPDTDAQPGEYKRLPPHAPFAEPPGRISERARRDWADTPETVRGDMHRMNHEFGRAVQQYRGAAEAFQPIAHFHQMAIDHGTTLEKALTNYTSIEQKLRTDPIAAIDTIVNNLGLVDPQTGQKLGLRDLAYTVLNQSPEQLRQVQMGNQQTAQNHQIGALHQEITGLKQTLHQMHTQQQFTYTRSAVEQYAESHPRFDELGKAVEQELKLGFDLDTAYRRAELLYPATHAAQTRTTSAQTRPVDRSIHGSPDVAPSNGASRRPAKPSGSPHEAVHNAIKRVNGHV